MPMLAGLLVNASRSSPLWKLPVMATVALARVVLSASLRVMPLSTATGVLTTLAPSTKAVLPPLVVATGAALAPDTVMPLPNRSAIPTGASAPEFQSSSIPRL